MSRRAFDARIMEDFDTFARNIVRLAVRDNDLDSYLMRDGTWYHPATQGESVGDQMGLEIPAAAIEAIAVAIQEWQGHTSHADTEARVLREWLIVERDRVDKVLAHHPHQPADRGAGAE